MWSITVRTSETFGTTSIWESFRETDYTYQNYVTSRTSTFEPVGRSRISLPFASVASCFFIALLL